MSTVLRTHEVINQVPPLAGYDVFGADAALVEALDREGARWASDELHELGRHASPAVADAFCASRLAGDGGRTFGTLPPGVDTRSIVDRARPTHAP